MPPTAAAERQNPTRGAATFAWALTAAFFALNLLSVLRHAMWRDEWHVWEMGRFTSSLPEMLEQVLHNGRPLGWYIIAWFICKAGFYPVGLKVFHVLVSSAGIYLLARFSPFTRTQVALLAFSYFPFYEYGTVLRDYAFETLAALAACAVLASGLSSGLASGGRRPVAFGLAIFLLTQTTAQGVVIAGALGLFYLWDLMCRPPLDRRDGWNTRLAVGVSIALLGAALAYAAMRPTPGKDYSVFGVMPRTDPVYRWAIDSIRYIFRGCVPISLRGGWAGNLLDGMPLLQAGAGALLVAVVARWVILTRAGRTLYLLGTGLLVGFFIYLPQLQATRYHGQYFIVLVLALWIDRAELAGMRRAEADAKPAAEPAAAKRLRVSQALILCGLAVHVVAGGVAVNVERELPFSGAREAAAIINRKAPPGVPVVGDCDFAVASVAGELDRPVYIACRRDYSTFLKCDDKRLQVPMAPDALKKVVDEFIAAQKRDVVLIVSYPLQIQGPDVWPLGATRAMTDERFTIFLFRYRP